MLRRQLEASETWRGLPLEVLSRRPAPDRWSVLEVVAHMNLSSGHYYKVLRTLYADPRSGLRQRSTFEPGFWGELMAKGMAPKGDGSIGWKMKTFARFEPRTEDNAGSRAIDGFQDILRGFDTLLEQARTRGLDGAKVVSTLGPVLRFKAGDAFRFPIAHQERHLLQIERTIAAVTR